LLAVLAGFDFSIVEKSSHEHSAVARRFSIPIFLSLDLFLTARRRQLVEIARGGGERAIGLGMAGGWV
jgi:hypothetical protein